MPVQTPPALVGAPALARTYDARAYDDAWSLVEDYFSVLDHQAQHPEQGSTAVSNALELPRSRVRSWLDGAVPDPVRGIQRAEARGWLNAGIRSQRFRGLNVLVAWVFSGGSIGGQWFVPRFAVDGTDEEARIDRAFEAVGVDYDFVRSTSAHRATEYRPVEDGAVLGRVLSVLGAPVGPKNARSAIALPAYLESATDTVRREFAATYLANRGQRSARRSTVTFREDRSAGYLGSLAGLFRAVTDERVTVSGKNVIVSAAAARRIDGWPTVLGDAADESTSIER